MCFGDDINSINPLIQVFLQPLFLTGGALANLNNIGVVFSWIK